MSCNCKVNKEIMKLHKEYGHDVRTPWKTRAKFKITEGIKLLILFLLMVVLLPLIFIFVIICVIRGKGHININKMLKFIMRKK